MIRVVAGGRRPPQRGARRRPRGDRAADQMALNGALIRADNSDAAYKRILVGLVERRLGREAPLPSYGLALENLRAWEFSERREILAEAALRWCLSRLLGALVVLRMTPGAGRAVLRPALAEVERRVVVVRGRRHQGRSTGALEQSLLERGRFERVGE